MSLKGLHFYYDTIEMQQYVNLYDLRFLILALQETDWDLNEKKKEVTRYGLIIPEGIVSNATVQPYNNKIEIDSFGLSLNLLKSFVQQHQQ